MMHLYFFFFTPVCDECQTRYIPARATFAKNNIRSSYRNSREHPNPDESTGQSKITPPEALTRLSPTGNYISIKSCAARRVNTMPSEAGSTTSSNKEETHLEADDVKHHFVQSLPPQHTIKTLCPWRTVHADGIA